ncbi:MAG: beta-ketoacyl synthase N-terminal-like domain-containing protein, partial [Candidatus Polarisedimenticolia bacterium]
DAGRPDLLAAIAAALPEAAGTVILTAGPADALRGPIQSLKSGGRRVLVQVVSRAEADAAVAAGADGLLAKGHEAGGRVGEETAFILLQRLAARSGLPVFAQGGIGMHTIAAAYVAGAAGAVLDAQLLLARESPLPRPARRAIERMDGSETAVVGADLGDSWRFFDRPGLRPVETLRAAARVIRSGAGAGPGPLETWRRAVRDAAGWDDPRLRVMPLGQDAAFAAPLARRYVTVAGILDALRESIETHVRAARAVRPLDQDAPLARSHGTRFPIVQGPMTRVSDTAPFALSVAEGGGLPFLALALMRAPEVETLLQETTRLLGERPWGVGILGFVPLELRQEQLEVVRRVRPRFALIAGGRPDQARALEKDGIATYLHVPSPGLLKLFLEGGARRFVFEGRECGGHVGPRSSFVLWDTMIDTILEALPAGEIASCHVLFAAGIHDALSASMVAALAAPLAEKGARVGVLLGTAYLFTREAVQSGAIVEGFQEEAIRCDRTVLLETGPGHATRCTDSEFARLFEEERRRLAAEGRPAEEIRNALEALNLGRLRVASKGVDRNPGFGRDPDAPKLISLAPGEQREKGMFMIGQVAALRDRTCAIEELHRDVASGGTARLAALDEPRLRVEASREERPSDVAIVGMSCLLPKAPDLRAYWENILHKVDAITEVPPDRFDWRLYFDADPKVRDKVYSKWGGFIEDVPFDPLLFGMPPNSLPSIEPIHLLTLLAARAALRDAGYLTRPFARERSSVILGAGGGISDLGNLYAFRSTLPSFIKDPPERLLSRLPEWTEDSFSGVLMNVAAGRVANRFDLGGVNCTVDAACASSLAALYMAVRELDTKSSDLVIAGGIDTAQNPFMFLCFSKTHAHAAGGRCRTFDENADGIVISEGIALLVLKRLEDAERDGDRVYAVIKAMAGSSDGRAKGLTAPRPEGQARALERAYARAGFSPATIGLAEAHGTGTVAGDQAEVTTLRRVFEAAGAGARDCALGSVKSMIGHTKCTAGVAGMAKIALALHHRALPPTLHVTRPNARAGAADGPFYVNTELRPWLRHPDGRPRRACVSAFGFGGTNFHAVLEEHHDPARADEIALLDRWSEELLLFRGRDRGEILATITRLEGDLAAGAAPETSDLAITLWQAAREREDAPATLAIVASAETLPARLAAARVRLAAAGGEGPGTAGAYAAGPEPPGVFFADTPLGRDGKVAFLFPGQGSQHVNMLRDLALHFEEVRAAFEEADRALAAPAAVPLSRRIFPPPAFSPDEERAQQQALTATDVAQPALGAAGLAVLRLLAACGVRPDMTAGHSYGEYVALCAAGGLDAAALPALSEARGRSILEAARDDLGTMAAVPAPDGEVAEILRPLADVWIANLNAPRQTVISGTRAGIDRAVALLKERGLEARPIPVACAFHSPVVAPARDRLAAVLAAIEFRAPSAEAFSNSTAAPYPADPKGIAALLADHLVRPVRFTEEILAMHARGARVFVEAGPKNVLTGLTQQILRDRPHVAVAADVSGRSGLTQFLGLLGTLLAHGVAVDLDRLFRGRDLRELDLGSLVETTRPQAPPPTAWLVNGGSARPMSQPKRVPEPIELPVAASPVP